MNQPKKLLIFAGLAVILVVALAAAGILARPFISNVQPTPSATAAASALLTGFKPTVLLVSLDGFRPDYLDPANTPALNQLAAEGVQAQGLTPPFPSLTFPSHYTIITGLTPEHHGVVSNTMFDPQLNASFSLSSPSATLDGRWYGGEPLWVTAQKQGQLAATMFWPGADAAIQGVRPAYWKLYNEAMPDQARLDQVLAWLDLPAEKRPTFLTLYFERIDTVGHHNGPRSPVTAAAVHQIDALVGALVQGLKDRQVYDQVNLVVLSDHGMTEISADKVIYLDDYINLADAQVVDWTPLLALRPAAGKEEQVYQALKKMPHVTLWKKGEVPYPYNNHVRITPLLALADEGWTITTHSYGFNSTYKAGHGYDPRLPSMQGIFIARGPGFKAGVTVPAFENVHIYELACRLLNLQPAPNDGSLSAVQALLR